MTINPSKEKNISGRRLPAEWEPVEAVMTAWPHDDTDWSHMLPEVEQCYTGMCTAIAAHTLLIVIGPEKALGRARECLSAIPPERVRFICVPTNDTWVRDYGAITVESGDGTNIPCDFKFNGWGLKLSLIHISEPTRRS